MFCYYYYYYYNFFLYHRRCFADCAASTVLFFFAALNHFPSFPEIHKSLVAVITNQDAQTHRFDCFLQCIYTSIVLFSLLLSTTLHLVLKLINFLLRYLRIEMLKHIGSTVFYDVYLNLSEFFHHVICFGC